MRGPLFKKPENNFTVMRLSTGEAVLKLYAAYMEDPDAPVPLTANVVKIKIPDSPDLEMDVLHRFSYYYNKAVAEEIKFLTTQYAKVVNGIISQLPPGKKEAVIEKADAMIRAIAQGDKPFITQQEFAKILKYYM